MVGMKINLSLMFELRKCSMHALLNNIYLSIIKKDRSIDKIINKMDR